MLHKDCYTLSEIKSQHKSFAFLSNKKDDIGEITKRVFCNKPEQVIFTGCGSSYYVAAAVYSHFIQQLDIYACFLPCFELELNRSAYIGKKKTLIIPFSRSSKTTEVVSAITKCREYTNVTTLAITCDENSSKYNDEIIFCPETEEQSVVMTKSVTSMIYAGLLVIDALSKMNSIKITESINTISDFTLQTEIRIRMLAKSLVDYKLMVGLGQGRYFSMAGESGIKIKEMCLIPTETYYTLEYRHGPISIADEKTLCMLYTSNETSKEDLNILKELKKLNSFLVCVGESVLDAIKDISDAYFEIPSGCFPATIIPAQFLGAYWALEKGLNPDTPRNLMKAVIL